MIFRTLPIGRLPECRFDNQLILTNTLAKGTERLKATTSQAAMSRSQDDLEIHDLSTKCSVLAEGLLAELKTLRLEQSGLRHAIKKSFRVIRHKSSLKEKQALLEKYQQVLDTRVLLRLDARSLKENQSLDTLDQDVRNLAIALEQGHRTFAQLLADQSQDLKDHIDKGFEKQAQTEAEHLAHQQLLESLFFPEIVSRQDQISEAFQGTYQWIFDSPSDNRARNVRWSNFHEWLKTGDGIYWISGKPGSGKSTLMKYIVNEDQTLQLLENWKKDGTLLMISFFFWKPGSDLQKSATGLLRSLLYQIAKQWPELINHKELQDINATGDGNVPINLRHLVAWTDQRLLSVLKCFLDQKPNSLWICALIDGLDEFVGEEELLLHVIRILGDAPQCKVCVSSRPEQAFRQEFRSYSQLRVQDLNHEDIEKTVAGKLTPHLRKYPVSYPEYFTLESIIVRKAEGVFLWLDLMIKILVRGARNEDSYETLRSRLEKTPDTINGLYTHIWENLDSVYQEEGLRYFQTLLAANELRTDMSLAELACVEGEPRERVIQFDREYFVSGRFKSVCRHVETRLIACCGGLLEVRSHSSIEQGVKEDSREENSEDEESDDRKAEKVDLDIPVTIPYYRNKVDFVHRTAFDFVRDQYNIPQYYKSTSYQNASTRVVIGNISQLMFLSLTFTRDELYESHELAYRFNVLMRSICVAEYLYMDATDKAEERSESLQVDLTHQAFQSLQQLYTFFHQTKQDCFIDISFLRLLINLRVEDEENMKVEDSSFMRWCPISDRLTAAAFFGCYNYVRSRLLSHIEVDELVPILFQCVISGFENYQHQNLGLNRRDIMSRLLIFQMLLRHNFDPNRLSARNPFLSIPFSTSRETFRATAIDKNTLWGAVFALILLSCSELPEDEFLDAERFPWQSCIADITDKFLGLGASPNTRTIATFHTARHDCSIVTEASPLALMDHADINDTISKELKARLRSAGAVSLRKPIFLCSSDFYRLTKVQSERLNEMITPSRLYHHPYNFNFYILYSEGKDTQIIQDIIDSFSKGDVIDEETVENEIASLPESF